MDPASGKLGPTIGIQGAEAGATPVDNKTAGKHDLAGHTVEVKQAATLTDIKTLSVVKQDILQSFKTDPSTTPALQQNHVLIGTNRPDIRNPLLSKTFNVASKNLLNGAAAIHTEASLSKGTLLAVNASASNALDSLKEESTPLAKTRSELLSLEQPDREGRVLTADKGTENVDSGKTIRYEYKERGVSLGTEVIDRSDVVTDHANLLTEMKARLEGELSKPGLTNKQQTTLNTKIGICERELKALKNVANDGGKNFIHSSYIRDKLEHNRQRGMNFKLSVNHLCQGMPVNMRRQHMEVNGEKLGGHFRLGIMAFHGNTHTNLEEMKKMRSDPALKEKKLQELNSLAKNYEKALSSQGKTNLAPKEQKKLNDALRVTDSLRYAKDQIEHLDESIIERETIMQMQFMHLLKGHIAENKSQLNSQSNDFTICHLALLNPHSSSLDKTGWMHDEGNEISDMNALFKMFDGAKMIFDGEGEMPTFGSGGEVHLPKSLAPEGSEGQPRTLRTIFTNISVQGYTKNDGMQQTINDASIDQLISYAQNRLIEDPKVMDTLRDLMNIKERLKGGESNFQLAEDLGMALNKIGVPFSDGCLSAKDRTGFVSARMMLRVMMEQMPESPAKQEIAAKLALNLLDADKPAVRVVEDNTGAIVLKVSPVKLPGIDKTKRATLYLGQAAVAPLPSGVKRVIKMINVS